jgi:hypothetical protein
VSARPARIEEPVRHRVLRDPRRYRPFLAFCCGKTHRSEYEVSLTIHNLWGGTLATPQIAVLLEKDTDRDENTGERPLVGVSTIFADPVPLGVNGVPGYAFGDLGAVIGVIGTDLLYRKVPLRDGTTRPGNALLEATLKIIAIHFPSPMPFVKAHVLPENAGSLRLFDEHRFDNLGIGGGPAGDQYTVFREAAIPPTERRQPTWTA